MSQFQPMWDNDNGMTDPNARFSGFVDVTQAAETVEQTIASALVDHTLCNAAHMETVDIHNDIDNDIQVLDDLDMLQAPTTIDPTDITPPDTATMDHTIYNHNDTDTANINDMFHDQAHGAHTHLEKFSLELLMLLRNINAPNYTFQKIMIIINKHLLNKVTNIVAPFMNRATTIKHFASRFNMHTLQPSIRQLEYKDKIYQVVVHNAYSMIMSLLQSDLFIDENVLFPNPDDPLDHIPSKPDTLADIDTGKAYRKAYKALKQQPHDLPCGLIIYMDKLTVDRHGHLALEPVYFTLSLFQRHARNKPEAWRPLGWIPNIGLNSKAETKFTLKSYEKVCLYHDILGNILRQVSYLMHTGINGFTFTYNNQQYTMNLKLYVLNVIGDTEAHDRLVGKFNYRGRHANHVCRHCNVPFDELDNPNFDYKFMLQSTIDELVDNGDIDGLRELSHHYVKLAWSHVGVSFGGNKRGIHGVTPSEPLHMVDLGLFKYCIQAFFKDLGGENCKLHAEIDQWARRIGRYLLHQSDRNNPRTYFPNGVSGTTKLAGHEYIGVVLVLLLITKMDGPRNDILNAKLNTMTPNKLKQWTKIFGILLSWRSWLKLESIPRSEVNVSALGHKQIMWLLKNHVKRDTGLEWQIIKFHMILHVTENIKDFGVPSNIDTSAPEHNHIRNAKEPCRRTQMHADKLEIQTATRYYENLVLDHASNQILDYKLDDIQQHTTTTTTTRLNQSTLQGSSFTISIEESMDGDLSNVKFAWTSAKTKGMYDEQYIQWLGKHVLSQMGDGATLQGCSEHSRNGCVFRGHPNYRGIASWHDWALFEWGTEDGSTMAVPGHIIMFVNITHGAFPISIDDDRTTVDNPGLYALVESLDHPLSDITDSTMIVDKHSKEVMVPVRGYGQRARISDKCLYLIEVESIYSTISAVPNIGGNANEFLFVRPNQEWSDSFSYFLANPM